MPEPLRLRLVLGKFRCVALQSALKGTVATIQVTDGYQMHVIVPAFADLRPGDILTFYTEVPARKHINALPQKTSDH